VLSVWVAQVAWVSRTPIDHVARDQPLRNLPPEQVPVYVGGSLSGIGFLPVHAITLTLLLRVLLYIVLYYAYTREHWLAEARAVLAVGLRQLMIEQLPRKVEVSLPLISQLVLCSSLLMLSERSEWQSEEAAMGEPKC